MAAISFTWIDSEANETALTDGTSSRVIDYSGLGMAPLTHFLEGVPSQHRQAHRGLKFRPRVVQLAIWDARASATAQDARHSTLLAAFNPDKGEGILKIVLSDGSTTRYLDCYVQEGPDFRSEDRPQWGQQQLYTVRFVAATNPFLYDPTPVTDSDNFNGATPVDVSITNSGHMGSYPSLTITGAVEDPKVELVSTSEYIELDYNLTATHHLDIDCEEGSINYDDTAMDPLKLTKASTLFYIPRAAQTLRLTATSGTGAFSVSFKKLYLGI